MPALQPGPPQAGGIGRGPNGELHFPPVTREHILHCSYDYWFPKYVPPSPTPKKHHP